MPSKNIAADVFRSIEMHRGDPTVCWEWKKSLSGRDARPYFSYDGTRVLAYRLVYELVHGPIPEGHVIRHKCDNPSCCNPAHIETGTKAENEQDKYERDRVGTKKEIVDAIKLLASLEPNVTSERIKTQIKQQYGYEIAASTIRAIRTGNRRERN